VLVCTLFRSDPVLQHDQGHNADDEFATQRVPSSPPGDGRGIKPGTGVIRDGSIKKLVSSYENKAEEVTS